MPLSFPVLQPLEHFSKRIDAFYLQREEENQGGCIYDPINDNVFCDALNRFISYVVATAPRQTENPTESNLDIADEIVSLNDQFRTYIETYIAIELSDYDLESHIEAFFSQHPKYQEYTETLKRCQKIVAEESGHDDYNKMMIGTELGEGQAAYIATGDEFWVVNSHGLNRGEKSQTVLTISANINPPKQHRKNP